MDVTLTGACYVSSIIILFFFSGALLHFAFMEIEDFHIGEN